MWFRVQMYRPECWGKGWVLNKSGIPFKLINEQFVEQPPINLVRGWKPKVYSSRGVKLLTKAQFSYVSPLSRIWLALAKALGIVKGSQKKVAKSK